MRTNDLNYRYYGLFLGTVVSVDDPKNLGRLRIDTDQYADGDDGEEIWAAVARPAAGNKTGVYFTPKTGDQVIVGYIAGDVEQPVVLGYAHSTADPPPDQTDKNKHGIVTGIGSVVFDEAGKSIKVTFDGPAGSSVTLESDGVRIEFGTPALTSVELNTEGVSITSPGMIALRAPSIVLAGKPSFGAIDMPTPKPDPTAPARMDFSDVGLAIQTKDKDFCVNGQGVALKDFVTELYNEHAHPSNGAPPDKLWSEIEDHPHKQVSKCDGPPP